MSEPTTDTTAEDETPAYARYQVEWRWDEYPEKIRRSRPAIDWTQMKRPGDPEERDQLIRVVMGHTVGRGPEVITLVSVEPLCNCEPFPETANCLYREHKGERFYLTSSQQHARMEVIHDRGSGSIVGIVSISESVEFLTQVRRKYGHQ